MSNPYQQYQKTSITTASREKILLMLYEGAIRFTKQAIKALEEKRIADKCRYISRATAIISELLSSLDFKAGGELANNLEGLYVFMIDKLIEGNIENKEECLQAVLKILETLHVAWKDVIENPRADGVPSPKLQAEKYEEYMEDQEGKNSPSKKDKEQSKKKRGPEQASSFKIST